MNKKKAISLLTVLFITLFSFNIFAMENKDIASENSIRPTPLNENELSGSKWTWINDKTCVRFSTKEDTNTAILIRLYEYGLLSQWAKNGTEAGANVVLRDTYSGKWTQAADGIWSFTFDDCTIPVGVTKIDGVLYAFNGYGELKADYEYYTGFKTEADGLVKADSAEFTQWLGTQYLPECTSHE
ncbi:hypothetical protein [Lacrimispora sp.]|uniref:hypothetical protein n=1 Tax=Lacrimispora sp. TaxID=2719234 RepID=UPI0028A95A14|nr:hypothetical protein [Lacrimispora sp.]